MQDHSRTSIEEDRLGLRGCRDNPIPPSWHEHYRHIRNYDLSNFQNIFQDGNGNGHFLENKIQMTFKMVIGNQWK